MKNRTRMAILATAPFFVTGIVSGLRAQQAAPDTVIRSESRLVLVDAVAVDKKGKFARDLATKDFRVWEDGKEQKITSFSLESSGVLPERPGKHYIVMYFDTLSGSGQMNIRQQAMRFVEGYASPDRYMAVLNYSYDGGMQVGQNFTTEADKLRKALSAMSGSSASAPGTTTTVMQSGQRGVTTTSVTKVDPFGTHEMLSSLRSLAQSLAAVRGRKALVLFGAGPAIDTEIQSDVSITIEALNQANVAVYTVGSGANSNVSEATGSGTGAAARGRGSSALPAGDDLATSISSLGRSLADGTGGLTFASTNELSDSLGKVAQEQDQYYLIGYTPAVDSAEGSCHELRVRVDRGDLEVRARKGYCTSKPLDVLSGKPAGKDLEAKAAGGAATNLTAGMQLPWFYNSPDVARVDVVMDINASSVTFRKDKGKFHGEFDLAGVAYQPDGSAAARVGDAVKLDFDTQAQVDAFLGVPYHYENQFEIEPGLYNFRMAFSSGDHGFGKVEMPLKIEPWNGQSLSLSAPALSHDVHPAADIVAGLDVSLLEGRRPLVSRGTEVVPTGTPQFHAAEQAFFYCEAYEPMLAGLKADASLPVVGLRIRILDRAGVAKVDTSFRAMAALMQPGNPVIPVLSVLPIAKLPAGRYKLEVAVKREAGDPVLRTADFDIR